MDNRFDFTERRLRQLPVPEKVRARYYDDKSPGLVLAVSPKGKRTFTYFRQIAGKLHCARLGEFPEMSITAARAEAGRLNGEILNGRNLSAEREQERNEPTFREAFEQYIESHATNRNNRRTVADKRRSFENYVSEKLGDKKL